MENEMADQQELSKHEMDDQLEEKTVADEPESDSDEPMAEADEPVEMGPAEALRHEKMVDHWISSIPEDFFFEFLCNAAQAYGAMKASGLDYIDLLRQPVSRHQGGESSMQTTLNAYGYPLRPGEKECSYYLKAGRCKFGAICRFNHPQPAGVQVAAPGTNQLHVGPSFPAPSGISLMSGCFAGLPRDVVSDILKRLPLKSIGISRCVSKPWLSLLTNYEFIKAHLGYHTHLAQEQKLLLRSSSDSLFSLTLHQGHGSQFSEVEFNDEEVIDLVGSCNGLVLVLTGGRVMWLVNFMVEEIFKLPASPFPLCPHLSFKKYGLGYDEGSDDYKIVKISQCDYGQSDDEPHCPDAEIFVDVYSLKMRSWKRLETPLRGLDLLYHDSCVFINGAFHWLGLKFKYSHKESLVICSFDESDEKFKEFPVPASLNEGYKFLSAKLIVKDGCLGIVVPQKGARNTEIWLMKSYLVVESWTKLVVDLRPHCFYQDRILFKEGDGIFKWYCAKYGKVEDCFVVNDGGLRFDQVIAYTNYAIAYTESLVSPHFNYPN